MKKGISGKLIVYGWSTNVIYSYDITLTRHVRIAGEHYETQEDAISAAEEVAEELGIILESGL